MVSFISVKQRPLLVKLCINAISKIGEFGPKAKFCLKNFACCALRTFIKSTIRWPIRGSIITSLDSFVI